MPTFSAVIDSAGLTEGEMSQILYAWASNFHPDIAAKLRKAADNAAYGPTDANEKTESHESSTNTGRRRVSE
jgi:hypothetical protein